MLVPAVHTVIFVDKECRSLVSDGAAVTAKAVPLPGGDKPFKCTRGKGDAFQCTSTRSGGKQELTLTSGTADELVLTGPFAMAVVDRKAGRFKVSVVYRGASGPEAEVCVGTAQID